MERIARFLLILTILGLPGIAWGQSLFEDWFPTRSVTIESFNPAVKEKSQQKGSEDFLDFSWPVTSEIRFVGDMPFGHIKSNPIDSTHAFWSYGNPYLGIEIRKPLHLFYWSLGIRLPLSKDFMPDSSAIPHYIDINRWPAMYHRTGTFQTLLNFHYENASGFAFRLLGGPQFGYSDRNHLFETYIKYAGQIRLKIYPLLLGGGIDGLIKTTHPSHNILEYYLEAAFRTGSFEPGITVFFPDNKQSKKFISYTIGFRLRYYFDKF